MGTENSAGIFEKEERQSGKHLLIQLRHGDKMLFTLTF
jgi:hypothetical protein